MNRYLLKEIQSITPVYDPLIIYVNRHYVINVHSGSDNVHICIKHRDFGEYIKVLYDDTEIPNMYSNFYAYSCIAPITKHTEIHASKFVIKWR
jgi:hypothetical protein